MNPEPNLTHPHADQSPQLAQKAASQHILSEWACLTCLETPPKQQFGHYCCPRQAYISCECSPEMVKIPIEHVNILKRHADARDLKLKKEKGI